MAKSWRILKIQDDFKKTFGRRSWTVNKVRHFTNMVTQHAGFQIQSDIEWIRIRIRIQPLRTNWTWIQPLRTNWIRILDFFKIRSSSELDPKPCPLVVDDIVRDYRPLIPVMLNKISIKNVSVMIFRYRIYLRKKAIMDNLYL